MANWKVLRRVYHNDDWAYPGQVVEADEKFDGHPNMERVEEEPHVFEPPNPEHEPAPPPTAEPSSSVEADPEPPVTELSVEDDKGAA